MQVFRGIAAVPAQFGPSAVTIGKFDGVHEGHREILRRLHLAAGGLGSTVVTFDRNPLALLAPERCPPPLIGEAQKLELLEAAGVAAVLILAFDESFAVLEPEVFVRDVLGAALHTRVLLVGDDFRFGHRGRGDTALLQSLAPELGYRVEVLPQVDAGQTRISSTRIRSLLDEGDVDGATRLLGRSPSVRGVVVHGAHRGRELGFPTANLAQESDGLIPADGVYAGTLTDRTMGETYPAAISVGSNPTFDGVPPKQVESFVLDQTLDLYGHEVEVAFTHRIRGMLAFEGVPALIAKIEDDVRQVRRLLDV